MIATAEIQILLVLGVFAALVVAIFLAARAVRRRLRSRRARQRSRQAIRGEKAAATLLQEHGYAVVDSQIHRRWQVRVDGDLVDVELRADHLVDRDGRRYVAEVKTGQAAPSITTAATRRQLLEYLCAYDVDGILLVDMERLEIRSVSFDLPTAS